MKNFKKYTALILMLIVTIGLPMQWFALSQAEKSRLTKNVILSKVGLERSLVKWTKYRKAVDKLIEEKKNDKVYLQNLINKLDEKRSEFEPYVATKKYRKIIFLIDYITSKAELELAKLQEEMSTIDITEKEVIISQNDKEKVEERMLALQSNILTESEDILSILREYTEYEQSGSYEMRLNIDEESFGTLMSEFKITDYIAKNNLFDSQITGDVEWKLEYSIAGQDMKVEFSSFLDAIVKDDDFYLMLDDVVSTLETENNELKALIDISKKISTQWKYVRFTSENYDNLEISKEMVDSFLNVNKYRSLLENPILETYKVEGDKYYLIPTESFCSEAKKLFGGILGNIGSDGCSKSQYNDMVEGFLDETNAYMTMNGNISTIYMEERWGESSMNISFNDTNILSVNMEIIDNSPYVGESRMNMSYLNGESINMSINTFDQLTWSFDAVLNNDNTFKSFDMIFNDWEDFNVTMKLENENLEWNIRLSWFWEDFLLADISWTIKQDYFNTEIIFEFADFVKRGGDRYKWNMVLWVDTRNNKNNFDMSLYINQSEGNIVELEMISESTLKYWEVEILAPTDYVEVEEVWSEEDFKELY